MKKFLGYLWQFVWDYKLASLFVLAAIGLGVIGAGQETVESHNFSPVMMVTVFLFWTGFCFTNFLPTLPFLVFGFLLNRSSYVFHQHYLLAAGFSACLALGFLFGKKGKEILWPWLLLGLFGVLWHLPFANPHRVHLPTHPVLETLPLWAAGALAIGGFFIGWSIRPYVKRGILTELMAWVFINGCVFAMNGYPWLGR